LQVEALIHSLQGKTHCKHLKFRGKYLSGHWFKHWLLWRFKEFLHVSH